MNPTPDSAAPWIGITDTMETVRPAGSHEPTPARIEEDIVARHYRAGGNRAAADVERDRGGEQYVLILVEGVQVRTLERFVAHPVGAPERVRRRVGQTRDSAPRGDCRP